MNRIKSHSHFTPERAKAISRQLFFGIACGVALLLPSRSFAERWTLIRFGANDASNVMPYPGWNQLLRQPDFTRYASPDSHPDHAGLVCAEAIPEGRSSYCGVRGTVPISFRPGQKIVVTFYNRSEEFVYPSARVSFTDPDVPEPAQPEYPWHTLFNLAYEPEGVWAEPHTLFELAYYISDTTMVNAINGPPSIGAHSLVNINLPDNNPHLVLTRIELSDECDLYPPLPPPSLRAEPFSTTAGAGQNLVRLSWARPADNSTNTTGISRYYIYRDGVLYDVVDQVTTEFLGTNLHCIDLNVAPDTEYEYRVSALDRAPYGLYPQGARLNSRFGNESPLCPPVRIRTPPWSSTNLINPWVDFQYRGAIRLPETPTDEWAYTVRLCALGIGRLAG